MDVGIDLLDVSVLFSRVRRDFCNFSVRFFDVRIDFLCARGSFAEVRSDFLNARSDLFDARPGVCKASYGCDPISWVGYPGLFVKVFALMCFLHSRVFVLSLRNGESDCTAMKIIVRLFLMLMFSGLLQAGNPNILWITSEDNASQWLACYGNKVARTPQIDALAAKGFFLKRRIPTPPCARWRDRRF